MLAASSHKVDELSVSGYSRRKPSAMPRFPDIRMARYPKTPVELERCISTDKLALDKLRVRVVCVVCTADIFIGCVDNIKVSR